MGLIVEVEAWKRLLGSTLSTNYMEKLQRQTDYINTKNKVLSREMNDLEDVRIGMKCLAEIRDDFISMDKELIAIEETYAIMARYNVSCSKEETDIVDSLRYNFTNMIQLVNF